MTEEAAARRLGQVLLEGSRAPAPSQNHDPELARLLDALDRAAPSSARRFVWLAAAVAAMLPLAWGAARSFAPRDLTYEVRGAARIEDQRVSADSGEPVELRFSEGSRFALSPGSKLRVAASSAHGSDLVLLEGQADASVVHHADTHWRIAAGPFVVAVVGTRFHTRWDLARQRLSVELLEGAVEVTGGGLRAPVAVRAGQRLEAGIARDDWRITPLAAELASTAASLDSPSPDASSSEASAAPAKSAAPAVPVPVASAPSWATSMSRSDFATIVEQAEAMGTDRCFATCTPANLRILADAARYTGHFELAESSLLALRRRSPAQAAAAAFFLGRLYESRGRNADALRLYEQTLAEAPHGDYAEQASAGRTRMLQYLEKPSHP